MSKIQCLIVDDEPPAIDLIKKYVGLVEHLEIVDTVQSAVKAFEILKLKKVDLLFLDIQMPVLTGIDFIKSLKNPPAIILTTAYREYALDGYDLDIIDYLLKPISFERFLKAVDRYHNRKGAFSESASKKAPLQKIMYLNVNRKQHKVILDEVLYIESLKDYVRIHTKDEQLVVKGNIGSTMKKLPDDLFIRIHRSFAVATQHVKSYNQNEVIIGSKSLPIGPKYKIDFINAISSI